MKHIKIRGHRYKVIHVDKFEDEGLIGNCIQKSTEIKILRGMAPSVEAETTIHEVLHALCFHAGVYIDKRGKADGEHMIDAISNGLFQLGFKPPIK